MPEPVEPPKELFVLMWKDPWRVAVTHDIGDWGSRPDAPTFWIRYQLSDYGTVEDGGNISGDSMGGETQE